MQDTHIQRVCNTFTATIASGASVSDKVCCGDYDTGMFYWPAAFTGATVKFQGSHKTGPGTDDRYPTFGLVVTAANADESRTKNLSHWTPIPSTVMAMGAFKFVSLDGQGAAAVEGAEREIIVCMK